MRVTLVRGPRPSPLLGEEAVHAWIEELRGLGVDAAFGAPATDGAAHHHLGFGHEGELGRRPTVLSPAVLDAEDLRWVRDHAAEIEAFVAPSRDASSALLSAGAPSARVHHLAVPANPNLSPRKLTVGIFNKVHGDGRTRNWLLPDLADLVDLTPFQFVIMGANWESTIADLRSRHIVVTHFDQFDREQYIRLMPSLDYFLYLGMDEGSMAWLDAVAAGVRTIATSQGYHLDAADGLTHRFTELDELAAIFDEIAASRPHRARSVHAYAEGHAKLWRTLAESGTLPVESTRAPLRELATTKRSPLVMRIARRLQARFYRT